MKFILLILCLIKISMINCKIIEDDEVVRYIKSEGYAGEVHEVSTEDGYILHLHRVRAKYSSIPPKSPVLLVHGAIVNSLYFLNSGKNISIAFYLADNGYDVWLGSVRGSKYSTAHKWLSTESNDYWKFSFHEMGVYDLPSMIDYMLSASGDFLK
jgi:lysosomal acid lipase/cholesteryl ester hydrolase